MSTPAPVTTTVHRPARHRPLAGLVVALLVLLGFGATASAGGWAVTTLDSMPAPTPGASVDVGFTIRQHGVTPVALDDGVGIAVTAADGTTTVFPAVQQGLTGHYVATVTFPDAGAYTWVVNQGWFAPQDLGTLSVSAPVAPAPAPADYRYPAVVRWGLPAIAALFAALAIADAIIGVRRRRPVVV